MCSAGPCEVFEVAEEVDDGVVAQDVPECVTCAADRVEVGIVEETEDVELELRDESHEGRGGVDELRR